MFSVSDFKNISDECLDTLITILQNIIENPGNDKYLSVSKASKRYQSTLCDMTGRPIPLVLLIFSYCGFADTVDTFACVDNDLTRLSSVRDIIKSVIESRSLEKQNYKKLGTLSDPYIMHRALPIVGDCES
jgi:hypothetical protein